MKKLLVIFAHPDDESFGPASSTIIKYARQGIAVHYLCATRGEAGVVNDLRGHQSIADLRTAELHQAATELGLSSVRFLDYRDSGMAGSVYNQHPNSLFSADLDDVAKHILNHIASIQPDAIITHDQYGWYGHPDHIKCYQATLRAYELLYGIQFDQQGNLKTTQSIHAPRLYVSTFSKRLLKIMVQIMPLIGRNPRQHGQNKDVDLVQIASWDVPTSTRIPVGNYLGIKKRAMACHASQCPLTESRYWIVNAVLDAFQSTESFARIFPTVAADEDIETDLFVNTENWLATVGVTVTAPI